MAILEQFLHFIITEQLLDFVSILLCLKEGICLVKSPREERSKLTDASQRDSTHCTNFPMLSSNAGARGSTVPDLRWRLIIAYRTG
jgi:hypothetical protein